VTDTVLGIVVFVGDAVFGVPPYTPGRIWI
jgi:hypothetical protein